MGSNEDGLANMIRPFFNTSSLERRHRDGRFQSTLSGLQLGAVALMAIGSDGLVASGVPCQEVNLVLGYGPPGEFRIGGSTHQVRQQPFLLPQCPFDFRAEEVKGLMLAMDRAHLVATGEAMGAGSHDHLRHQLEAALERPGLIDLEQGRSREHLATLQQALGLVDQVLRSGEWVSPHLALDNLLSRLVLLLVLPELDQAGSNGIVPLLTAPSCQRRSKRDRAIDALVDWILANLHHPIRLADLEQRSGLARRTLQKRFKQRFGLGPTQWVRLQRLEQARQMIEAGGGAMKIGPIAQSCGYHNLAAFSRDFQQVFGLRASELGRNRVVGSRH